MIYWHIGEQSRPVAPIRDMPRSVSAIVAGLDRGVNVDQGIGRMSAGTDGVSAALASLSWRVADVRVT